MGRRIAQLLARAIHVPKALQRTRVRLPARVPLLHVTPHLLPCFLSKLFSYSVNKAEKGQKNTLKKKKKKYSSCSNLFELVLHLKVKWAFTCIYFIYTENFFEPHP